MAQKKGQGSSRNGRDSHSKRLGVKVYEGQTVTAGSIIVRQRGSKIFPSLNTKFGRDFTVFATSDGIVSFKKGSRKLVSVISS